MNKHSDILDSLSYVGKEIMKTCKDCDYFLKSYLSKKGYCGRSNTPNSRVYETTSPCGFFKCTPVIVHKDPDDDLIKATQEVIKEDEDKEYAKRMCLDCTYLRIAGDGCYLCGVDNSRIYGRGPACSGFINRGYRMICSNCKNYNAAWKACKVTGKGTGEINACESFTYKEDEMLKIKKICFNCDHYRNDRKFCALKGISIDDPDIDICGQFECSFNTCEDDNSQEAKADSGKLQITLVPRQIIKDIAEVRMYGNKKYGSPDNWKQVEAVRYRDALMRHLLAYLDDPDSVDEESGIKHLKHIACNVAFLCEMEDKNVNRSS